jgi:hypothetical protein
MNKKLTAIVIVLVFLIISIAGCISMEEKRFIGEWGQKTTSALKAIIIFHSDRTGTFGNYDMNWEVRDGNLQIRFPDHTTLSYNYKFENNDNTLILMKNNVRSEFIKKVIN